MIRNKGRADTNRGKTDRVCDNYQGQICGKGKNFLNLT